MRNTDTTKTECEGAALALPAAHQTASEEIMDNHARTMTFDAADLAMIAGALEQRIAHWKQVAQWCREADDDVEAETALRHAAHCARLLKRI